MTRSPSGLRSWKRKINGTLFVILEQQDGRYGVLYQKSNCELITLPVDSLSAAKIISYKIARGETL